MTLSFPCKYIVGCSVFFGARNFRRISRIKGGEGVFEKFGSVQEGGRDWKLFVTVGFAIEKELRAKK